MSKSRHESRKNEENPLSTTFDNSAPHPLFRFIIPRDENVCMRMRTHVSSHVSSYARTHAYTLAHKFVSSHAREFARTLVYTR